jgi:hypothetical protein
MIVAVAVRLLYLIFRQIMAWLGRHCCVLGWEQRLRCLMLSAGARGSVTGTVFSALVVS